MGRDESTAIGGPNCVDTPFLLENSQLAPEDGLVFWNWGPHASGSLAGRSVFFYTGPLGPFFFQVSTFALF